MRMLDHLCCETCCQFSPILHVFDLWGILCLDCNNVKMFAENFCDVVTFPSLLFHFSMDVYVSYEHILDLQIQGS